MPKRTMVWFALIMAKVSFFSQKANEALTSEKRPPVEVLTPVRKWPVHSLFEGRGQDISNTDIQQLA